MRLLCKTLGGSHSYGLDTPQSDTDYRGIFINTDVSSTIGLGKEAHQIKQDGLVDESYTEFRNAMKLLRSANTQMIELLFNENWLEISPEWKRVIGCRQSLIDSEKLFSCLRGYMQGELKLANGERTGKLGGKRKEAIDTYGFSPKNFVQLFRLAWAGSIYFTKGYFPVDVKKEDPAWAASLLDIKTNPKNYTRSGLNAEFQIWEQQLQKSFEARKINTTFNENLANQLCLEIYAPIINNLLSKV